MGNNGKIENYGKCEVKQCLATQEKTRRRLSCIILPNIFESINCAKSTEKIVLNSQNKNNDVWSIIRDKTLKGGLAGSLAQCVNVVSFMWLRTVLNHQYRYGGSMKSALIKLYSEGGVPRFYRGLFPALIQSPLSRFGDTAANVGVLAIFSNSSLCHVPTGIATGVASGVATLWRLLLMPIDAWKTTKQVEGKKGLQLLLMKTRTHGLRQLYQGGGAAMASTALGHYPWFVTHNLLSQSLPSFNFHNGRHFRNALIGFCSAVASDVSSNSVRVVKTTKQTMTVPLRYTSVIGNIVRESGVRGLFLRGLSTRILTNALQGMVFSFLWKAFEENMNKGGRGKGRSAGGMN